jgi:hypothetical protein
MKEMTVGEAVKLTKTKSAPAISIYLKTDHRDRDGLTKIRANLARLYKSVEALVARTYDGRTKERLLEPLKRSLADLRLTPSKGGIAIYHNEHFTGMVKVPTSVPDLAIAAESFHLKPMFRCAQVRRNYYLLALRKRCADLYMVTPDDTRKLDRIELTRKWEDSNIESDRSGVRRWFKGGRKTGKQRDPSQVMAVLNQQLSTRFQGERCPLVIAGSHNDQMSFRKSCQYPYVLERGLIEDIDYMDQKALADQASQIVEQYFNETDEKVISQFRKATMSGLALSDLKEIAYAVARGQVQNLLIAEDRHIWGHLDRETGATEILKERHDATSDDLLDDIAELTLLKGGSVTVLQSFQMPGGDPIGAILRWNDSPYGGTTPAIAKVKGHLHLLGRVA